MAFQFPSYLPVPQDRKVPIQKQKPNTTQSPNTLVALAKSIAQLEGYNKPGTLAQRHNNPGNLRYVGQSGAVKGKGGFAVFRTPQDGFTALHNQILLDAGRGLTLQQFVYKYAPPTSNNTASYLNYISRKVGADPKFRLQDVIK